MQNLFQNEDGATAQVKAVLAYVRTNDGIEASYSAENHKYEAQPRVSRWENGREQGYVISLTSKWSLERPSRQLNIAFYEHRNSDEIVAVKWEQRTMNAPTIDTMTEGTMKDKYDVSHREDYGHPLEMADWIMEQLSAFWAESAS